MKTAPIAAAWLIALPVIAEEDPGLFIGVDEVSSVEELRARVVEEYGEDAIVEIPADVARLLEAMSQEDDIQGAMFDLAGFPGQMIGESEHHDLAPAPERLPTEEVLSRMSTENVELLAPHGELLDDQWKLLDALDGMNPEERNAALEFIHKMHPLDPIEGLYTEEQRRSIERARERGWYEMPGLPRGSTLLAEIEAADAGSISQLRRTTRDLDTPRTDDFTLGSGSYVLTSPGREIELYPTTSLGGVMYVERTPSDAFHPHDPNLFIAGHDGMVSHGRHEDGTWITTVAAFDGEYVHHIMLEKKLEGAELDAFVQTAISMIETK